MKKNLCEIIRKIAEHSAKRANGVASEFGMFQPKSVKAPKAK